MKKQILNLGKLITYFIPKKPLGGRNAVWYGLYICVPRKFIGGSPGSQYDGILRWGF